MKYYFVETWEDLDPKWHRQFLFATDEEGLKKVRINERTKIKEVSFTKYVLLGSAYGFGKEYREFMKIN